MYKVIGGDQKEYGPVSAAQLRDWIAQGRVGPQTPVLAENATQWKALAELPEFSFPVASAPGGKTGTNTMAVVAFITSLFSLFCCCLPLGAVSLGLALVAHSQLKKNPEQTGKGFVTAAMIISILGILLSIAAIISMATGVFDQFLPQDADTFQL